MAGFANETSPPAFLGHPLMWFGVSRKGRDHSCTTDWWTNRIIKWLQKLLSRLRNLFRTPLLRLRAVSIGSDPLNHKNAFFLIWSFLFGLAETRRGHVVDLICYPTTVPKPLQSTRTEDVNPSTRHKQINKQSWRGSMSHSLHAVWPLQPWTTWW